MTTKEIHRLAVDIGTTNNSWFTNSDIPEVERVLLEAESRGELERVRLHLLHGNLDAVNRYGYNLTAPAYEARKASPRLITRRAMPAGDYEAAILANQDFDY